MSTFQDPNDDDLDDDTDTMLPPGEVRTGADVEAGEEARAQGLKPADIDAYWLQRNVNKAYNNTLDENEAVKKAEEVFNALQVSSNCFSRGVCCSSIAVGGVRDGRRGCSWKEGGWLCILCVLAELDAARALQLLLCICMEDTLKKSKNCLLGSSS